MPAIKVKMAAAKVKAKPQVNIHSDSKGTAAGKPTPKIISAMIAMIPRTEKERFELIHCVFVRSMIGISTTFELN